jgi:hypothetical protein
MVEIAKIQSHAILFRFAGKLNAAPLSPQRHKKKTPQSSSKA